MEKSPNKFGIGSYSDEPFSLKSGNKTSFKTMGATTEAPGKHRKDGSWTGHEHKTKLGEMTGKIANWLGTDFKETGFGKAIARGTKQIKSNISDDVKGNLFEGVGKSIFNLDTETQTDDVSAIDEDANVSDETTSETTTNLSEEQMGSGNLYDFYKAGGGSLPSRSERKKLYEEMGGEGNYTGTIPQNTQLLEHLKK